MSLHERLKRIEDRLAKLESTATEHAEFISEIKTTIGNDITTMAIAKVINRDLFLESGDAWKIDVRRRVFSAAFGICA